MNIRNLDLTPDEMRNLGYNVIDILVEHFAGLRNKPAAQKKDRKILEKHLCESIPLKGKDPQDILDFLVANVFTSIMNVGHPRFFAFIPSPNNFVSVMADALISGFNVFAGTWLEGSSAAQLESVTIDWLCRECRLPESSGGLFVSGGSIANLTALITARKVKLNDKIENAVVYLSDQTHISVEKGLQILGFKKHQMNKIPCDNRFRLEIYSLLQAVQKDIKNKKIPFCVVANAGTTNTGAVDPLLEIHKICVDFGMWHHIDGAYGAAAVLSKRGHELLKGIEYADSLSLDPHKWLFQPYEIGCILVREKSWLKETFQILPEYLADAEVKRDEINFCDHGIQLTRNFRALKLWMSLKVYGKKSFEAAINRGFKLAETAEKRIRQLSDWKIETPAQLGILTFRFLPEDINALQANELNKAIIASVVENGSIMISSTMIKGNLVLRMCTINPRTTENDIKETVELLDRIAQNISLNYS